ncbi:MULTISPECIES: carbohydrate ABC transporter permease [unclassified Streptomyces]|uniref:carbohydrate ABC transporter permease n=1 Tax=unclassified Streptomyces TaxID=2593676 RepID=UPI00081F108C|nr:MULTISPECIES: carbohydrate ABC transporter permease [unclassified Streptomyces]MYR24969.1 ABC transporter permease subunit [Streptomyces sp. SID4945]SCE06241.1 multiple sugar transport system permease protein [Streptomyces sp. TverLS-915]SCE71152.1 multiple sugar transport system permease protein [Streptomyces sp. LcepLS]
MSTTLSAPRATAPGAATGTRTTKKGTPVTKIVVRTVIGLLLAAYAAVSLYPFLWMVSAAFKTNSEVQEGGHLIPHHPTLHTLTDTWNRLDFFDYFLNSVKVTVLTTVLVVVIYSAASYAFATLNFPGKKWLYRLFLVLLFVPGVVTLLPVVLLESKMDILGTHWGLILPGVNGSAPLAILMLTNSFNAVPGELREAARMDGAGELRIFTRIYLPLTRPALITIALLTAIPTWNEYQLARISLNDPSRYTLPIALQQLQSSNVVQYNSLMAAALIMVIPVIILFLCAQRYFVNGLVGAVKG